MAEEKNQKPASTPEQPDLEAHSDDNKTEPNVKQLQYEKGKAVCHSLPYIYKRTLSAFYSSITMQPKSFIPIEPDRIEANTRAS